MRPLRDPRTIVALIVLGITIILSTWQAQPPYFFTDWVLYVFIIYLGLYLTEILNKCSQDIPSSYTLIVDSTIFTLCLSILVGFITILITDFAIGSIQVNSIGVHFGYQPLPSWVILMFLIFTHCLPISTLIYLNGIPQKYPSATFILCLGGFYVFMLSLAKNYGPATQYLLPEEIWVYVILGSVFIVCIIGVYLIVYRRTRLTINDGQTVESYHSLV